MSSAAATPRTLADQLRGWSDEQIAQLLAQRPDLAMPAPHDSSQLASRVGTRASVTRAVDQLTTLELTVLSAALAAGGTTSASAVREVVGAEQSRVDEALSRVRDLGLLWGTDDSLRPLSILGDVVGPRRAGTGPSAGTSSLSAPPLATAPRDSGLVDRAAAGAAHELVRHVELLLEAWGTAPPANLRAGGLGVRELKAAARLLHLDERTAALHVEIAHDADLLAVGRGPDGATLWLPTDAFDLWAAGSVSERWTRLALAWLGTPRLVGVIGRRDAAPRDKPANALGPELERPWLPETRRAVLSQIGAIEAGSVLAPGAGVASLVQRVAWLRPRRPAVRAQAVSWVVEESAVVGVTALGGLSSHGRALLEADDAMRAVPAVLEPLLPPPVDHVLVQADLTAVAPGPLQPELARHLATVADIESRGGATVYRFTETSVRRAFDSGWSAREVHDFVGSASRTPVPQALTYLVDDVARRFGTIRVGAAESFLRSDDEAALTELVHDTRAASLRLRRIAPTVLVSDVPVDVLLERLRELGSAPVLEAPDGSVRLAKREVLRARTPRARGDDGAHGAKGRARQSARIAATVTAIRAGDRAAATRPAPALRASDAASPASNLAALRAAADDTASVWMAYLDNNGSTVERVVDPVKVDAGWLSAYDHRTEDVRSFAVHRITAVRRL